MKSIKVTGNTATYQTVKFPVTSIWGSRYIMVLHDYDSNAVIPELLKSRSKHELVRSYTALHTKLTNQGLLPIFQTLDNECPAGLKTFM